MGIPIKTVQDAQLNLNLQASLKGSIGKLQAI